MSDHPSRGSRMAENESFAMLMDSLRRAEECARQLAHHRGDLRWIKIARSYNENQVLVSRLIARSYHENQVLVSRLIASSLMGPGAA